MEGCSPCKSALEDLERLALERGGTTIELRDAVQADLPAAPCTCVVADGKEPDMRLDCVIGYSPRLKDDIRKRLGG